MERIKEVKPSSDELGFVSIVINEEDKPVQLVGEACVCTDTCQCDCDCVDVPHRMELISDE